MSKLGLLSNWVSVYLFPVNGFLQGVTVLETVLPHGIHTILQHLELLRLCLQQ